MALYLGTGRPDYSALMPNVLLKNVEGRRFEDTSTSSGTGHLQKGHGVSFADWEGDGDLDLFVEVGGAVPGDRANNLLFRHPGHGRHWLAVKLVGARTNRVGIGARIRADFATASGSTRSVFRQVGAAASYGGSSLVEHIGLGDAGMVEALTITWPASRTSQTFRRIPADRTIEIVEGGESYRVVDPSATPEIDEAHALEKPEPGGLAGRIRSDGETCGHPGGGGVGRAAPNGADGPQVFGAGRGEPRRSASGGPSRVRRAFPATASSGAPVTEAPGPWARWRRPRAAGIRVHTGCRSLGRRSPLGIPEGSLRAAGHDPAKSAKGRSRSIGRSSLAPRRAPRRPVRLRGPWAGPPGAWT